MSAEQRSDETRPQAGSLFELVLLVPETAVEPVGEALDALDALSTSVEDADAMTDAEQALFGEPGMPPPKEGWQRSRVVALFSAESAAREAAVLLQAQVVENVRDDAEALSAIVAKSQGAEGSLQAQQATNQLLALTAKQQFQLQQVMAAQFRADALEQSRRTQAEIDGRAATRRFLGTGKAYSGQ